MTAGGEQALLNRHLVTSTFDSATRSLRCHGTHAQIAAHRSLSQNLLTGSIPPSIGSLNGLGYLCVAALP
jgi:hypothetical protein